MTSSETPSPVAVLASRERLPPFLSRSELTKDSKIVLPRFKWQRLWMILPPHDTIHVASISQVGSTSRQSTQASMGFIAIVYSRQYRFLASTTPSNIYSKNI
ncbi:hypothetical protein MUK42_06079 [Musa troglodytarum]|uniref:Uncharacterized protein n=1 Tax=Musa troglodytarum TaxID=320322 RepID=A0A9E7HCU0_9LILI|nr:hypothetical protein MUK42_06079 [Musa troglodytarum]